MMYVDVHSPPRHAVQPETALHMPARFSVRFGVLVTFALSVLLTAAGMVPFPTASGADIAAAPEASIRVDDGHPWRPPFGVQRIGRPLTAVVEITTQRQPAHEYTLVANLRGKEISRSVLELTGQAPFTCRVALDSWPTQLVLYAKPEQGEPIELAREIMEPPSLEAEATARPETVINPVDLGAILVPSDYLLLAGNQTGWIEGAAIVRRDDIGAAGVTAWFNSDPSQKSHVELAFEPDRRAEFRLALPAVPRDRDRDTLLVSIDTAGGEHLWQKEITTTLVQQTPEWPRFGAVETKLRYDAPISVRADDGTYSPMRYEEAWSPELHDVVVALPNGSRFVFWRGSSYVPFWAGRCNTGLSYEWAETSPPADGFTDCVEPLMDKELRYGRVRIIESTPARVHVRWSYQSCDFQYKVWGDSAVEDFYFYPDGFGTRVLTLQSEPTGDYELSEFIILTPPATYPLSVLPANLVDVLYLDGEKRELTFPFFAGEQGEKTQSRDVAAIYRVRLHNDETLAAVYFNPFDLKFPPAIFAPFFDKGELVTPTYWGSHWPLARGKTTGSAIDDRVQVSPCHNSVMSWARHRPPPLRTARLDTLDTLGRSKSMIVQTWVWLIGMSDQDDARLRQWAHSFSLPPALELDGARLEAESYIPERRAIRLIAQSDCVTIRLKPFQPCVHPVFEICRESGVASQAAAGRPFAHIDVQLDGQQLASHEYAWDGVTLWLDKTLGNSVLRLTFAASSKN